MQYNYCNETINKGLPMQGGTPADGGRVGTDACGYTTIGAYDYAANCSHCKALDFCDWPKSMLCSDALKGLLKTGQKKRNRAHV